MIHKMVSKSDQQNRIDQFWTKLVKIGPTLDRNQTEIEAKLDRLFAFAKSI